MTTSHSSRSSRSNDSNPAPNAAAQRTPAPNLKPASARRPYSAIAAGVAAAISTEIAKAGNPDRQRRMEIAADALWDALRELDVSWVGFYLHRPAGEGAASILGDGEEELVLGPRRDKPACTPIGMHGACGQAFRKREPLVVRDVAELGPNYIACDPRDRSEVVVPLFDEATGACWGVLDADSHSADAFSEEDAEGLATVLRAAGLTKRS